MRDARTRAGLSQEALGALVGVKRYTINRIEAGSQDPGDLAERLAQVLNAPEIQAAMESEDRAQARDQHGPAPAIYARDELLGKRLLGSPGVDRLDIVLADEFDVLALLQGNLLSLPTVRVVFPTQARLAQLRGDAPRSFGLWRVQRDINALFEAQTEGAVLNPRETPLGLDIRIFDSPLVQQSFALVGTPDGTWFVSWPSLPAPGPLPPDSIPAAVTKDSTFVRRAEDHLNALLQDRRPLTHLKVVTVAAPASQVVRAPAGTAGADEAVHVLSTFFTLGSDVEEQFARTDGHGDGEYGFAIALVLVHGVMGLRGRPLGRRIFLALRPDSGAYELISTHLSDEDLRSDDDDVERSTMTAHAAIAAFHRDVPSSVISVDAFRRAARRAIKDECGIDVELPQLREVALPRDLWSVEKAGGLAVIPRLFTLDLTPARPAGGSQPGDPVSDLLDTTPGRPVGRGDFTGSTIELNDFLKQVQDSQPNWWAGLLSELDISWT